jgi:hypothetical protein
MGTRSLTRVIPRQEGLSFNEGHEKGELAHVNMYRQFDGYPGGHGLELAEFLKDFNIINGIGRDTKLGLHANGSGCLAAQMIKHFKEEVGNIYLYPADDDREWEEYIYTVYPKENEPVYISIWSVFEERCIFVGTPSQLIKKYKSTTNNK